MSDYLTAIEGIIANIKAAHPGIDEAQVTTILQNGLAPVQAEADQTKADLAAANQQIADLQKATTDLANADAGTDTTGGGTDTTSSGTTTDTLSSGTDTTTGASS